MLRVLLAIALLVPALSNAQVYKTTDDEGNVIFSDTPPVGATDTRTVDIPPTNTATAPVNVAPAKAPEAEEKTTNTYTASITAPANETTIAMGPGNFSVSASVTPKLKSGAKLQLMMDGAPHGEPQAQASWNLTNVFRGAHDISVDVIGADGQVLASSSAVRVYVLRPSVNFNNR